MSVHFVAGEGQVLSLRDVINALEPFARAYTNGVMGLSIEAGVQRWQNEAAARLPIETIQRASEVYDTLVLAVKET